MYASYVLLILPLNNTITFYCRSAVEKYGLWDQLRIDHGQEFYLSMYIQEQLRATHGCPTITHVQSRSIEVKESTIIIIASISDGDLIWRFAFT